MTSPTASLPSCCGMGEYSRPGIVLIKPVRYTVSHQLTEEA